MIWIWKFHVASFLIYVLGVHATQWDDDTTPWAFYDWWEVATLCKMQMKYKAIIKKSHNLIFYSQQNTENIKCLNWENAPF